MFYNIQLRNPTRLGMADGYCSLRRPVTFLEWNMRVKALCGIMTLTKSYPTGAIFDIDARTGRQLAKAGNVIILDEEVETTAMQPVRERATRRKGKKRGKR